MFAIVVALVSFYVAIRVSLSEASRRLSKLKESWKRFIKSGQAETMPIMESSSSRRRTGLVNSLPRSKHEPRKYSRKQLLKPFLDTGNWFQGNEETCETCENESNAASTVETSNDNITNMLKVPTDNHNASLFDRFFHQISFIVHKEKAITYPDVSEKVLVADRVKSAIKTSVMEDLKGHDNSSDIIAAQVTHKQRAVHVLHQMRSCISAFLLKIAAWVMYKLLGKMLDGIEVRKDQVEALKKVSEEKVPIIYLPLHRSHLDYILVTFILFMNDMRAPLVAAGNNLMIPFFGSLLRGLGAFFIKRKLDPQNGQRDFVYRAILHTYMEESLKAGHSLEFFIEGGRSRTGKAVLPKAGLLSIVVDTLMSGGIKDAYIVPIAMSYEKLLDGNFISEQLGRPKQMESFTTAIRGIWRTLHSNFGTVSVDFCKPFSLKEFLCAAEFSYNSPATALQPSLGHQNQHFFNHNMKSRRRSEYGTEIVSEDHRQLIKDLADYIVYDASNAYALMSTNLLAFLLLTKHRKGTTFEHLVSSMSWLREEILRRNKTLTWNGDSDELIVRATRLLGNNLVRVETVQMEWSLDQTNNNNNNNNMKLYYYKPSVNLPEVLELQYYANAVLPIFLIESIIINAIYSFVDEKNRNEETNTFVQRSNILKQSLELCSIMQYEFIFSPPGTSVCSVLNAAIDDLLENSLLQLKDNSLVGNTAEALPDLILDEFFIHGDRNELKQEIMLSSDYDNLSDVHFLRCILSPFIESYFIVASTLPRLIDSELEETSFLHEIKSLGSKKIHIGQICHDECVGLDTLRNALKLFESWKVIDVRSQGSQKLYSLHRYYNDTHKIEDIIARIAKFMH